MAGRDEGACRSRGGLSAKRADLVHSVTAQMGPALSEYFGAGPEKNEWPFRMRALWILPILLRCGQGVRR